MRWRSAAEEVAAASATSSMPDTNSRRSLSEQAEDPDHHHHHHTTTPDDDNECSSAVAVASAVSPDSILSNNNTSSNGSTSTNSNRGQKRALEHEKKQTPTIAVEGELPDTVDTSTESDTSNTAQESAQSTSIGGSRKSSDDEGDDDDDDDDDGTDHAEDETASSKPTITWKPQNVNSTCEFTHTILDYAQKRESGCKKAEYSAVTEDELGNRWRLIVYVNGNGRASNHHLSLFLQVADADDLPFGWKKAVSYVLTLEHPSADATLSYAKRNPDKTFKLCPKAIDWGWSQFITSDRIQQEGYVKSDTLTVRAQVSVKSSSVAIDEEDSELYLKCAVEEGDANSVKLCLDQGASVNCQFKDDLYTPLHTACSSGTSSGSMDVLNLLLESSADANACNKWKETPLLIAANNGHREAVEALLKHGADPSLCSEAGWSALTFAAHKGYDDIVALLLQAGAPVNCPVTEDASTPLHKACAGAKAGHLAAVKMLLAGGADVHALNKWRETPLLTAANHGQAGALEALLAADADPCKCTDTGWSPLSIAAYKGHDEVVRLLLEDGAPTEEDDPTLSALLQAATKGLPDTVELLLRHGADHTVTTKKGDTALSILVEQNLIDAAVEMVAEYNASIPRCSRDRKKVQRARLLINLRMKQLEREGNMNHDSSFDEEESDEEQSSDAMVAQHLESGSQDGSVVGKFGKKGKKAYPKELLEEKARLAEEALIQELEKEDAQLKMEEAKANSKQAKKKKKKERERLQKMKEDEERRHQEELEATERDRIRKEKEERLRKEREEQQKLDREREVREMLEREKTMAVKRKEREEREKRQRAQNSNRNESGSISPTETRSNTGVKNLKAQTDPTPHRKILTMKTGKKPSAPLTGNRRWETASKGQTPPPGSRLVHVDSIAETAHKPFLASSEYASNSVAPPLSMESSKTGAIKRQSQDNVVASLLTSSESAGQINGVHVIYSQADSATLEHPAVALFRKEKVFELLAGHASSLPVGLVDEAIVKRVLYRWIVRASHGNDPFVDPIIPSWTNQDLLATFFQRQFIAEVCRRTSVATAAPSMESLKEAGSSFARICQHLAKQVVAFRQKINEQIPSDWTDVTLGMTASDGALERNGTSVTIAWSNRAHIVLPSAIFAVIRDRHVGQPSRFLASAFVGRVLYETNRTIVAETSMDLRLSPKTQEALFTELGVSAELWSDPFSPMKRNVFWGRFEQIDHFFGGQKPFGKDEHGIEQVLAHHGGSLSGFLPLDAMIASIYVQRMIDILELANQSGVPVSFAVFLGSDCFPDVPSNPSSIDLRTLDPRLSEHHSIYVTRVDVLEAGQHAFLCGDGSGTETVSSSGSLFVVLQNEPGQSRHRLTDSSASRILATLLPNTIFQNGTEISSSMGLPPDFRHEFTATHSLGFEGIDPISPNPQRVMRTDFGTIGGTALSNTTFSPVHDVFSRGGRRGRLFDLIDDGEDEHFNDDIMSGMLNTLDVGLFHNANVGSDVDIEAISLMGIGGPPRSLSNPGLSQQGRFG